MLTISNHHFRRISFSSRGFFLFAFISLLAGMISPVRADISSKGTEFWLAFPKGDQSHPVTLQLLITSDVSTTGQVQIAGTFTSSFTVTPGSTTQVLLPSTAEISAVDGVTPSGGIHVTAAAQVSVVGLRYEPQASEGYLGLPVESAGSDFMVFTYYNESPAGSEFTVVATQDCTHLAITPKMSSGTHTAGVPYGEFLANAGDVYQFEDQDALSDVSGTAVSSDKPVALFGAHVCGDIPGTLTTCNYLVEQLWPTQWWGSQFVTMPLTTRSGGDTFRFLAATDGTSVYVNGSLVSTLNRSQYSEHVYSTPLYITASNPIYVMQYSNSSAFDGNTNADPSMTSVPPVDKFTSSYNFSSPVTAFTGNYANLLVPNSAVGAVTIDGFQLPAAQYTPIASSSYSGAWVTLGLGAHQVTAGVPFGVTAYGYAAYDAYGYPGGVFFTTATPVFTATPGGPCASPTPTNTLTPTVSFTPTPSRTPTPTPSLTATVTLTYTKTPTVTLTFTNTLSATLTPTLTPTMSPTNTGTPTLTSTLSLTPLLQTATATLTNTLTFTSTPTMTPTLTPTQSSTPTATLTWTSTKSPTLTLSVTSTLTLTPTLISTSTPTESLTNTVTSTWTATDTPTLLGPSPTETPTAAMTDTPVIDATAGCEIHVWPNPFNPPKAVDGLLKISCLPEGATVVFYTLAGEKVQELQAYGGMATWNGLNRNGNKASSDVYFYLIQQSGKILLSGKLLVVYDR